jgi:uncharacterized membrane protein YGL010W
VTPAKLDEYQAILGPILAGSDHYASRERQRQYSAYVVKQCLAWGIGLAVVAWVVQWAGGVGK